jgi:uridine kinase
MPGTLVTPVDPHTVVRARLTEGDRLVAYGTRVGDLLPGEVSGLPVVAALVDHRPVSLDTPMTASCRVAPLSLGHWEGERIHRRSLGIALAAAAASLDARVRLRLGASRGFGQEIFLEGERSPPEATARALSTALHALVASDVPFRTFRWSLDEAIARFKDSGAEDVVDLLRTWRDDGVPVVACGDALTLSFGPVVPTTSHLTRFSVAMHDGRMFLVYRDDPRTAAIAPTVAVVAQGVGGKRASEMAVAHEAWLERLGVRSVGALSIRCVEGRVKEIVLTSEGFHEKRVGEIATEIASRAGKIRLVCVAGPSSAGKTTFLRRLEVQLRVVGITPKLISLDDYYLDRDKNPRDERGELDFEAFEALDVPLLQGHLAQLLEGASVKTARFDFSTGKSARHGGAEIQLRERDVLVVEGIHGLHPHLTPRELDDARLFRIFVNPSTTLAFDGLTSVNISDLRLIRRIVRDRRLRATAPEDNIMRWPSVRRGERRHVFPHLGRADAVFDSSLVYEPSVMKVFAERYLLEVDRTHPAFVTAHRLRGLLDGFVAIYPEHVPKNSLLREFIGGSEFDP